MNKRYDRKDAMSAYKASQDRVFEQVNGQIVNIFDCNKNPRMK